MPKNVPPRVRVFTKRNKNAEKCSSPSQARDGRTVARLTAQTARWPTARGPRPAARSALGDVGGENLHTVFGDEAQVVGAGRDQDGFALTYGYAFAVNFQRAFAFQAHHYHK